MQNQQGFTLIELIMVIVLTGIIGGLTSNIITLPIKSYFDQQRRTELVDSAETTVRLMQRDVRSALPNSIRISSAGDITALELLHASDGGVYRAQPASDNSGDDVLDFSAEDTSFDILGTLTTAPLGELVIFNLNKTQNDNAYIGNNRTTISNSSDTQNMVFDKRQFPLQSPSQRFFIIDTPITYQCDTANGTLTRFHNYPITETQSTTPAGGVSQLQINHISSCSFNYSSATAGRYGLLTLQITLTNNGESARLIHQVHVDNAP